MKKVEFFSLIQSFLGRVGGMGFAYIFTYLVAQRFGAGNLGIFSLSYMFLLLGSMVSKLGLDSVGLKYFSQYHSKESKLHLIKSLLLPLLGSSIFFSIVLFAIAPFLESNLFKIPGLASNLRLVSLAIPIISMLDFFMGYLKAEGKFLVFSLFNQLGRFFIGAIFLVILPRWFDSYYTPILALFIGLITSLFFVIYFVYRNYSKLVELDELDQKLNLVQYLKIGVPMLLASSTVFFMGWIDTFMLGYFESSEEVGVYNVAVKLAMGISFLYTAANAIVTPNISKLFKAGDIEALNNNLIKYARLSFWFALLTFIAVVFAGKMVLTLFGPEFSTGYSVLVILSFAQLVNVLVGFTGPVMQMTGFESELRNILLVGLLINVVFNVILFKAFGVVGVAIASGFSTIIWNLMCFGFLKRKRPNIQYSIWGG